MANRLTAAFVRNVKTPGRYGDGHGLMLCVQASGSKQWVQRLTVRGRRHDIGLGGFPLVGLAEARDQAIDNRKLARAGGDPLAAKRREIAPTFREAAAKVIDQLRPTWRDGSGSLGQWTQSLEDYAYPYIGRLAVDEITTADVIRLLTREDLWTAKHETARRLRGRLSKIMQWAVAHGFRADDPAGSAIEMALPRMNRRERSHHRAAGWEAAPEILRTLAESDAVGIAVRECRIFGLLCAVRPTEAREARWSEIDMEAALWTIPAERMGKTREAHVVPLSKAALAALARVERIEDGSGFVFPSPRGGCLSRNAMTTALKRVGIDTTAHGFRATFRTWCGDTGKPREVAEACLAHALGSEVERAYHRSTMLDRRRVLMDQWSAHVTATPGDVVSLRA